MKRRNVVIIAFAVLGILAVVFFLLQANSQNIALLSAGVDLNKDAYTVEDLDLTNEGKELRVLQVALKDGKLALVQLTKDSLGFWHVTNLSDQETDDVLAAVCWIKKAGRTRYTATDVPEFNLEYHFVYCGTNALKRFVLEDVELPDNTAVDVHQVGEFYVIHIITFSDDGFQVDIAKALRKAGFIA